MTRAVRLGAAAVALAVIATGWAIRRANGGLGTATPPFVPGWSPRIEIAGAAVAVLVLLAAVALGPRLLDRRLPPLGFSAASYVLALCVGMAVNLAREGADGWSRMFTIGEGAFHEGPNEYLPGLPTLGYGVRFYLDRFAEMATSQPVNVAGHPPGPLLLMDALGITTAGGLAALCIVAGASCAPLAHRLSWTLDDEPTARIAGLLCALSPALVLLGVSSYDVVFAAFGALAACLLVARSPWWRAAGLVVFALATLMSWALLAIGAWAAIVAWRREGWRAALVLAAACGVAVLVLDGALALATGYDPVGALAATKQVYDNSLATRRPYLFWVFGSPVAWAVMTGVPIIGAALAGLVARRPAAIALAVVVLVAALGGFTKAETERIWLFMVPLACVAAAPWLRTTRLRAVLAFLAAQAIVIELLYETVW
jgi:methylthioxylose transferase